MDDRTLGERGFERLRSLLDAIRSRPVALVAVLVVLGSLASTAPTLYNASSFPSLPFNYRILSASAAFGTLTQLGLVVAGLLLVIDRMSTATGQRSMFTVVAVLGAIGAVANLASMIIALSISVPPDVGTAQVAEGRSVLVLDYLAPAVLAGLTCWIGVIGARIRPADGVDAR